MHEQITCDADLLSRKDEALRAAQGDLTTANELLAKARVELLGHEAQVRDLKERLSSETLEKTTMGKTIARLSAQIETITREHVSALEEAATRCNKYKAKNSQKKQVVSVLREQLRQFEELSQRSKLICDKTTTQEQSSSEK